MRLVVSHLVLDYIFPFFISLFLSGFFCEVSFFRVSLIQIKKWTLKTWLVVSFLTCVFAYLIIITFIYCERKDLYFVPIIPFIVYILAGLVLSLISRHPSLRFHPRSYQLAFAFCLLRKENNFYNRLFAAMCTGVFVRCVAANSILSLLEPVEEDIVQTLSVRNSAVSTPRRMPSGSEDSIVVDVPTSPSKSPSEIQCPLLEKEEDENWILQTIEEYNREVDNDTTQRQARNESILAVDENNDDTTKEEEEEVSNVNNNGEVVTLTSLHRSRMSDFGDWNEQQKMELFGN